MAAHTFAGEVAIVGIGATEFSKASGRSELRLATEAVKAAIADAGITPDQHVLLLCRSGVRSQAAARYLTQHGFTAAYNVSSGFEGPHDAVKHRGTVAGWKATGLPWVQG